MTLSGRVCGFFLCGLAAVLTCVVVTLTVLAHRELARRVQEHLDHGIATLVASAEIEPHELEWDRAERQIALGAGREHDEVRWLIRDAEGRVIDQSLNLGPIEESAMLQRSVSTLNGFSATELKGDWLVLHRRVRAERPESPPPDDPLDDGGLAELTFSVSASLAPVRSDTRAVATAAAVVAVALWLIAALVARWYCRRALAPILSMAAEAQRVAGHAPDELMQVPPSGDELETLGTAFNLVLNECRVAFDRQASFASAAAHQLRSPLTAMLGELEVALRRPRSVDEQAAVLRATYAGAQDLQRTVESLLRLTRLRGSDSVRLEPVDFGPWMAAYVENVRSGASADRIMYRCSTSATVRMNDVLLRQLLDNLIDNALEYSPESSPVTIEVDSEAQRLRISVIDAGPGIAAADLPHVFESFYRSARARSENPGGSGLGLAIAHRIAEVHQGTLSASSAPEQGSRFTLELPVSAQLSPKDADRMVAHVAQRG